MNCKHCKAQWTPPEKASISSCPFCGKPLVDPAGLGTDTKPEIILKQVVERFDLAILGEKRLSAILKDLMPHLERKYQRIFTQAVNEGVGVKLLELTTVSQAVRTATLYTLKENFRQHNGFDHSASYVIDCFLYALGWVDNIEEQESHIGINPIKLLNQQIEFAFADKILTSDEAKLLFQSAQGLGIAEGEVVKAIEKEIKALNLKPKTAISKSIKNEKYRICSTDWIVKAKRVTNVKKTSKDDASSSKIVPVAKQPIAQKTFKSVIIGKQIWMKENLNVAHFRNGDPIPQVKNNEEWKLAGEQGKPAWCYYNNDPANGKKYGKLYNWYAVNDPRGLAPMGWHLPNDDEWSLLIKFLGGEGFAGEKLKAATGWAKNGNGKDDFGFSALPSGCRLPTGTFGALGIGGSWWSSTVSDAIRAWHRLITYDIGNVRRTNVNIRSGFSVRCLKDIEVESFAEVKQTSKNVSSKSKISILPQKPTIPKAYKSVKIGKQIWMAENLNVANFRNGVPIPEARTKDEWELAGEQGKPAWCYYDNDPANGKKYGKLYNWFAVNDPRGLAPKGWRIPKGFEWIQLTDYLVSFDIIAGKILKAINSWDDNGNGTNNYGFSALPGGERNKDGTFINIGRYGIWWSYTFFVSEISSIENGVFFYSPSQQNGYSVRCLKDISEKDIIKEVRIGNQLWLAENLNVDRFLNGDQIHEAKTDEEWKLADEQGKPAWCYYDNNPANSKKYGKLYNCYAVNDPRGLAPKGWLIPSDYDWIKLIEFLGGEEIAGAKLKEKGTWNNNSTDDFCFSALPGGSRREHGKFVDIGKHGDWWTSTQDSFSLAFKQYLSWNDDKTTRYSDNKGAGFSIRCVKHVSPEEDLPF